MHNLLIAFAASFVFVFLKAFQQRNVAFDNYWWVVPTSMAMGFVEYATVFLIVKQGYYIPLILAAGVGAGLGAVSAMFIHKRYIKKNGKTTREDIQATP